MPIYGNGRPPAFSVGDLGQKINASFAADRKALRPEYFIPGSELSGSLAFLVLGIDESQGIELVEGLIAKEMEVNGVKVVVFDIVFVTPPYRSQGHMPAMVNIANAVYNKENDAKKQPRVSVLRTKNGYAHTQYSRLSDIDDSQMPGLAQSINGYRIHGFKFLENGRERFQGAHELFEASAKRLAKNPDNFYKF